MESVDLSELAMAMNSSDMEAYLDPASGEVHLGYDGDFFDDDGAALDELPNEWVRIERVSSHEAYEDMLDFAEAVPDSRARARLLDSLEGSGAFRRFRNEVHRDDDGLGRIWLRYRDICQERRAARWLADEQLIREDALARVTTALDARLDACLADLAASASTVLHEVMTLERELQSASCRADPARLDELLSADFTEIGASGRLWDRDAAIRSASSEPVDAAPIEMRDLDARAVTEDVVLVRWTSTRAGSCALRSSLWRREQGVWRLAFHQGTPCGVEDTADHDV